MAETLTKYPAANLVFALETFDGPLDLLLYLIKKDEIDIYDIPIAEVTRQYLSYLDACRELNLEIAGEFLYIASMLIRIKVQMLLPRPDEQEVEDPRDELVSALLEYRKVKKLSSMLEGLALGQARRFTRGNNFLSLPQQEQELVRVDIASLMIAFGDLIRRLPGKTIYQVEPSEITVDLRKEHILSLFEKCDSLAFEELFADDQRKIVMVVTFIAILELVKIGTLRLEQAIRFSPIRLFKGESKLRLEIA